MVINVNTILNVSANRNVGADDQRPGSSGKPETAGKLIEAAGQSHETRNSDTDDSISKLPEVRKEVVDQAKEKLNNGHYNDRQTALDLAKTILDIF